MENRREEKEVNCNGQEELAELIISEVCKYFEITKEFMCSNTRKREVVLPRQLATYFVAENVQLTLKKMGKILGNKHHSTVIYSRNVIADRIYVEPIFRRKVIVIEKAIKKSLFLPESEIIKP